MEANKIGSAKWVRSMGRDDLVEEISHAADDVFNLMQLWAKTENTGPLLYTNLCHSHLKINLGVFGLHELFDIGNLELIIDLNSLKFAAQVAFNSG